MLPALALGLLPPLLLATATWLASLPLRDASLADRIWSLMIALPGVVYALQLAPDAGAGDRITWMLALVSAWALRLAVYVSWRNHGHGEDSRYAAMRGEHGASFAVRSFFTVFLLQAVLAWIVSWPLLAGAASNDRALGPLDWIGAAIAAFGILFEAVADAQLARFRANPANRGQVLQHGLWRYSRHPNYFGEACIWWGLGAMALAGGGLSAAWTLASPLLMTLLLLRVSGVTLLEKDIGERRPAYRDYIRRTSAFVPLPPRRTGDAA
jgi:steroid 5-alpha reductase family enzyme